MKRKRLVWLRQKLTRWKRRQQNFLFIFYSLDPNIMKKSGRILIVAELAKEYGFKDVGGTCVYLVSSSGDWVWPSHDSYFGETRTLQTTSCLALTICRGLFLTLLCDFANNRKKQTWSGWWILQMAIDFETWCLKHFYDGLIVSKIEDLFEKRVLDGLFCQCFPSPWIQSGN